MGTYHQSQWDLEPFFIFLSPVNKTSPNRLYQDERIKCNADAVMWVGQRARQSNGLKAEYKNCCRQQHGHDLQPDVEAQSHARVAVVETSEKDSSRYDGKEGYGSQNAVSYNEAAVPDHVAKAVSHA
jgi:hypothetical protein